MRNEKALIRLLRDLVQVLSEEAECNPKFADKLDHVLRDLKGGKVQPKDAKTPKAPDELPDVYNELNLRGETDFRLWLRDQPIPILRAVIRKQDIDPTRRTAKWKEAEKLAEFIADCLRARLSRGSAFIGRNPY
jgi:hypothetical protein